MDASLCGGSGLMAYRFQGLREKYDQVTAVRLILICMAYIA